MELEKHIADERTGIGYTLCGDYYLPDLKLSEEKSYDLGRFGRAKLRHLRKCHRALLTSLRTRGKTPYPAAGAQRKIRRKAICSCKAESIARDRNEIFEERPETERGKRAVT